MLLKRYALLLLSCLLIFATFPIESLAAKKGEFSVKDEVIYANLHPNGNTEDMYVVNSFQVTEPGEFIDYGSYEDVRNLTDLTDITLKNDNEVHFEADDDFFYQGTLKKQALPWHIKIDYLLDGKKIAPDDLAGKSGQLEIQISTKENTQVDPVFFEYYILQVDIKLDPLHFENIQAPEGTEANEGKDKLISFNVMPDKEEVLIATSDVTDFELDPIQISAVPANVGFDDPDTEELAEDMQELSDAISDINDGVAELEKGASDLNNGASELSNGSNEFLNGINELDNSSGELVNGSKQILDVFKEINTVVSDVPEIPSDLDQELNQVPKELRTLAKELRSFSEVIKQFDQQIDQLPDATLSDEDIKMIAEALGGNDIDESIIEAIKALGQSQVDQATIDNIVNQLKQAGVDETIINDIKKQLENNNVNADVDEIIKQLENNGVDDETIKTIVKQLEVIAQAMNDLQAIREQIPDDSLSSIQTMANELDQFADELEGAIENVSILGELNEFKNGLTQLSSQYQDFHNGLITYTNGVKSLAQSYKELNQGISKLASGSSELTNGISELHKGTKELAEETSDLPEQFTSEIDEFMDEFDFSDFEAISYVSDENKDIGVVQFVLKTKKIEVEEPEDEPVEQEKDKNIWTRFLDLFR